MWLTLREKNLSGGTQAWPSLHMEGAETWTSEKETQVVQIIH